MPFGLRNSITAYEVSNGRKWLVILLCVALFILLLSLWQGASYLASLNERQRLEQNAVVSELQHLAQRANEKLSANILSFAIITSAPTFHKFAANPASQTVEIKRLLSALINFSPDVFQVRIIGADGHELYRIDKIDGQIITRSEDELQDKKSRPYFTEALNSQENEFYISDLNLNIEQEVVEEPWHPTLRIAKAIYSPQGKVQGIAIINIDANVIFNIYQQANMPKQEQLHLLNPEGYWIYGMPKQDLWGFMFGKANSLKRLQPELWRALTTGERTEKYRQEQFTAHAVTLGDILPAGFNVQNPNRILWYALHSRPTGVLHQLAAYLPIMALLFGLLIFAWAWQKLQQAKSRAEKELIKSEKLSSLGGLVAGVAHELNTPIGSAVTIASTVESKARFLQSVIDRGRVNKSEILNFIQDMERAGDIMLKGLSRANDLLGHFKQVAVDQSAEQMREFNLDDYIEEMSVTFKHLFKQRSIALELNLNSCAQMTSYPGSISQVIINLVQNALTHGFAENEQGLIEIVTQRSGNHAVKITVTDNGRGIAKHHIHRIFEPFFTTKLGQGGSGLGLHIAHNIACNVLLGELQVVSDCSHRYTQFSLIIPCDIRDNQNQAVA